MYRVLRRKVVLTQFQQAFARAGHAHAGVLVILSLVVQLYADTAALEGILASVARNAVAPGGHRHAGRVLLLLDGGGPHRTKRLRMAPVRRCGLAGVGGHGAWRRTVDRVTCTRARLQELHDAYRLFELTLPALLERWSREHPQRAATTAIIQTEKLTKT
jgi:hypothetical protein